MTGDVFVQRTFEVDGREVKCRFFRPEECEVDYVCRYEIEWPGQTRSFRGYGVDEVQALLLAMQNAHIELLVARTKQGLRVEWLDQQSLGLPIAENVRDLDPDNRF
ncbi:DUF6968 family protein [Candidatus Halocynthiibacter alkanivorans]|uniref:DUF6968 family protein n=1 Tax=Candidatus Halocynthiibacter alkanivorans TaxID=2267619 RepID=UPI000DF2A154|nr:hypothetical protein [Candidatus Halocynthiibacter alkanivorans]